MGTIVRTCVLLALLLLGTGLAPAEGKATSDPFAEALDEALPALLSRYQVPGAVVSFIDDGEVVWTRAYGMANVEAGHLTARYGGEEFAVIMPRTDSETAFTYAERIRQRIKEYHFPTLDGREARVTVSIGLATYPDHLGGTANRVVDLIAAADDQLVVYAKNGGRDRVCRPGDF